MSHLRAIIFLCCWSLTVSAADSSWTEKWSLKGDFRFRNEQIKDGANIAGNVMTETEQNRHRIRARLTANGKVNEAVDTTFRLATGSSAAADATSTNQSFDDYTAKKSFNLDLAYANWQARPTANVWIGKSPVPYYAPGTSDLLLDTDITVEGISYKEVCKGDSLTTFWNMGYSILNEQHNSTTPANVTDVMMNGADIGVIVGMGDAKVTAGIGNLSFPSIKESVSPLAKGNSLTTTTYTYDYRLTRGFLEISGPLFGGPVALFVDYAKNADAPEDNTAQLVGLKVGKAKEVGDLLFSVDYRELKKDSTVGILAESDGAGGGTDTKSTRFNLQYQLDKGVNVAFSHYDGKRAVSTLDIPYKRSQLDFGFVF